VNTPYPTSFLRQPAGRATVRRKLHLGRSVTSTQSAICNTVRFDCRFSTPLAGSAVSGFQQGTRNVVLGVLRRRHKPVRTGRQPVKKAPKASLASHCSAKLVVKHYIYKSKSVTDVP